MNNEIDDALEFSTLSDFFDEKKTSYNSKPLMGAIPTKSDEDEKSPSPGQPTQYSLYGSGYTATTPTIGILPSGCYNIMADNQRTFVVPAPKPTGLLLELPEMRSDDVIKLVENFWDSEKDYKEGNEFVIGGAAYKAGIMLYGPPGSGKSCTIKIVSNKLVERGGTVFYASAYPGSVMDFLTDFAKIESNRKCIVILEDIDSLIQNYGESSYLEMLDSAKTIDNVLFIATTNYPDRLDPRIYNRPGRFSSVVKVGLPGPKAREAYLKAILKNHRDVAEIVDKSSGFSIDHLSALVNAVYREKKSLNNEIERLRTLFKVPKVEEERPIGFGI
jgi:Cdc6-like AAA superfamily ATPase